MRLEAFVLGEMAVNSYLLWDEGTKEAVCIDPGRPAAEVVKAIEREGLRLAKILLTHGHADHIGGVEEVKNATGASVSAHSAAAPMLANPALNLSELFGERLVVYPDILLADGDIISIGSVLLKVRHTPGHSPGGICLLGPGVVFTGDLIFAGSVGRTDLPGGDLKTLAQSVKKVMQLPDETKLLPGHGPATTVGRERLTNPFLKEFGC
ncbi:MAG: MBL fold metallo-hydrolase [Firmicutes bacterium]|nr:MBL fold metallo-hydrolase [Bacillota bacterium]